LFVAGQTIRNRAKQQFAQASAPMSARDEQINFIFTDDFRNNITYFPVTNVCTMRESSKAQRKLQHVLLGYAVRVFVNGPDGHRIDGTRPHAVDLKST